MLLVAGVEIGDLTSEQRNKIRNSINSVESGGSMSVQSFVAGSRKCSVSVLSKDKTIEISTTVA